MLGVLGLPVVCGATVRSVAHLNSLCVYSKTYAPGERPTLEYVIEQRVTSVFFYLLLGKAHKFCFITQKNYIESDILLHYRLNHREILPRGREFSPTR